VVLVLLASLAGTTMGQTASVSDEEVVKEMSKSQCDDPLGYQAPGEEERTVNCRACRNSKLGKPAENGINYIAMLPYFNLGNEQVTHNLGYYDLVNGQFQASDEANHVTNDPASLAVAPESPSSPINIAQAYGQYFGALVMVVFLFILCSLLFCCGRYCCCCMKGGCCGKRFPTKPVYNICDKFATRLCMASFVLGGGWMIYFAYLGSVDLTDGMVMVAKSPTTSMNVVQSISVPFQTLLEDMIGKSTVATLQDVNRTIAKDFDTKGLLGNLKCIDKMVAGLPDSKDMLKLADDTERAIGGLPESSKVVGALTKLNDTLTTLPKQVKALNNTLEEMDAGVKPLRNLQTTKTAMTNLNTTMGKTKTGIQGVQTNLSGIFSSMPSSSTISLAVQKINNIGSSGGVAHNATELVRNDSKTWRDNFKSFLNDMKTNITTAPSAIILASDMEALNTTLDEMVVVVDSIVTNIEGLQAKIQAMPKVKDTIAQLKNLSATVDGLNFTSILNIVVAMNRSVASMPNTSMVGSFIDGLKNANRSMVCVHDIGRILNHVNETLIWLPSSFSDLTSQTDSVQETIDKALNKTDKIVDQLNDLNSSLSNLPNFTKTIQQIKDLKNESGAFNELNISDLIKSLEEVENSTDIDFDSVLNNAKNISNLLKDSSSRPTKNLTNSVRDMNDTISKLPNLITDGLAGFVAWESGRCQNSPNISCDCGSSCNTTGVGTTAYSKSGPSASCGATNNNCLMTFAAAYPARCASNTATSCTKNSDCTNSDCTWPDFSKISNQLDSFSDVLSSTPDTSTMTGKLADSVKQIDNMPSIKEKISDISNVEKQIGDMPNISEYTTTLTDLDKQLKDTPDIDEMITQWNDVNESIASINMDDITSLRNQSKDLNKTKSDFKNNKGMNDAKDTIQWLDDFLYLNLEMYLQRMNHPALQAAGKKGGIMEILDTVVNTLNDMISDVFKESGLMGNATVPNNLTIPSPEILNDWEDFDGARRDAGGVYYFSRFMGNASKDLVQHKDRSLYSDADVYEVINSGEKSRFRPTLTGVFNVEDKTLTRYRSSKTCISTRCLENEIIMLNREPMFEGQIPASREVLTVVALFLIPAIAMLIGLCGCMFRSPCCSMTSACWIMCTAPCCLMIFGVLFFLIVMIPGDVCASTENLVYSTAKLQSATMCSETFGGVLEGKSCTKIKFPGNLTNETMTINVASTFEDVFKDCESKALGDFYDSMAQTVGSIAPRQINKAIDPEGEEDKEGSLRPGLKRPFKAGGKMMGQDLETFVLNLGKTMTCKNLNMMYYDLKEAICCGLFNGLFKLIGSVTFVSLLAIFCGCPGGIRGYKHFPKDEVVKAWHYEHRKDEFDNDSDEEYTDESNGLEMAKLNSNPMLGYTNVTSWSGAGPVKKRT